MGRMSTAENSGEERGGPLCWLLGDPSPARGVLPAAPQPSCLRVRLVHCFPQTLPSVSCPENPGRGCPSSLPRFHKLHCGRPLIPHCHTPSAAVGPATDSRKGPHTHLLGRHGGRSCDGRGHPAPPPSFTHTPDTAHPQRMLSALSLATTQLPRQPGPSRILLV